MIISLIQNIILSVNTKPDNLTVVMNLVKLTSKNVWVISDNFIMELNIVDLGTAQFGEGTDNMHGIMILMNDEDLICSFGLSSLQF